MNKRKHAYIRMLPYPCAIIRYIIQDIECPSFMHRLKAIMQDMFALLYSQKRQSKV